MPLKFTTKFIPDGGRLGRWALFLQNYSYKTEYKRGKTNTNADTLSRIPFPEVVHDNLTPHPAVALCSVDPSDLVELQQQGPEVKPFYDFHHSKRLPKDNKLVNLICRTQDQYIIDQDRLLYHISFPNNRRQPEMMTKQIVMPKGQRHAIIASHHDSLMGGVHQGIDRTFASITLRAYWPGMQKTVQEYVKSC